MTDSWAGLGAGLGRGHSRAVRSACGLVGRPRRDWHPRRATPRAAEAPPLRPSGAAASNGARAAMAEAVERTDELVREYLLFRGFTYTLRQLEAEIKADKEKGFRVRGRRARAEAGGGGPEGAGSRLFPNPAP